MRATSFAGRVAACIGSVVLACGVAEAAPESYRKLWRDPAVDARIAENIERYRKGDLAIELVDAAGKPVAGATVEAAQTGHEFLFGCNAFVLGQLETAEQNRKYEEGFLRLFNFATVPFYWEGTEPARGELRYQEAGSRDMWRRPPPDRYLPWAEKHGVTLKGHPLLWHAYNPPWLPSDAGELKGLYRKRFREIAGRYGGKIGIWDVVNESLVCKTNYPLYTPGREYVRWAFEEVAPLFPEGTTLMINEVTNPFNFLRAPENPYFAQIKSLLADGAKIRGIGFQYHYFRREKLDAFLADPKCDPNRLLDVYEQFGEFGLPLYVTEITFPSAGEGGEALQEEVVRDHYRLWFSAPRMAGITWWNLGDGTAVKGENEAMGGLVDANFEPKAAYRALDRLINGEWKTRAECRSDAGGVIRFRGFFGRYSVEVSGAGAGGKFEVTHSSGKAGPVRLVVGK